MQNKRKINKIFLSLCEKNDSLGYLGWDHVDGLNSRIFTRSPFYRNRLMRLAWMQFFKHSPINFRKYTEVPKSLNPKGLALILLSYTNYYRYSGDKEFLKKIYKLINLIKKMSN